MVKRGANNLNINFSVQHTEGIYREITIPINNVCMNRSSWARKRLLNDMPSLNLDYIGIAYKVGYQCFT